MRDRIARAAVLGIGMGALFLLAACNHLGGRRGCDADGCYADGGCPPGDPCHDHAKVCHNPTVHALASDLDHLEKHIDWYGSVVAKVPDVWGQARLTQYREDFESQMYAELGSFKDTLNGSLARSDQAFFAQATALGIAAQPKPPVIGRVVSNKTVAEPAKVPDVIETQREVETVEKTGDKTTTTKSTLGLPPTPAPEPEPKAPETVKAPPAADADKLIEGADKVVTRKEANLTQVGFGNLKTNGISLEPTIHLAQKARYLDYLNQLRRTNEGSDTADAPGYSLNLMRIPVSVLPGKRTDEGHGAEVTFTLDPVLGDDLLPMTFRNLVQNDLRHQLGVPLTQFLNDRETVKATLTHGKPVVEGLELFNTLNELISEKENASTRDKVKTYLVGLLEDDRERLRAVARQLEGNAKTQLLGLIDHPEITETISSLPEDLKAAARKYSYSDSLATITPSPLPIYQNNKYNRPDLDGYIKQVRSDIGSQTGVVQKLHAGTGLYKFNFRVDVPPLAHSPGLINKTGFPTSQLIDVYGLTDCFEIAFAANQALKSSIDRQGYAHLPDVQAFLQQEIFAAYRFLREPEAQPLWHRFCTPEVVSAVRTRKLGRLQELRHEYRRMIEGITQSTDAERKLRPYNEPGKFMVTAALAWCYIVDSALLTDRLIQDMRETATAKGKPCPGGDAWLPYFLPCPPPEARQAFAEYVKLRWPIYVFALDPVTQDQNLADSLSTRREMQLALAVAFTNGMIGVNSLTKYTRRLEAEYETIALNRTQVGFAHGENTFGWRFYPRFQTPDTESNLTVFVRDQLIGGPNRNALLRQRRLEPGQRDCVALVIMPSFVPYVTVDAVSNWFALANPKHKVLDHTQAVRLSKTVRTLEKCDQAIVDADCYREGELHRMQKRVEQLANRLPAQTMTFPVPVLNTLGGFEMFSNGTTDLAPELYGWYGAPGVSDVDGVKTTLFLVGDHFSPLRTRVIVGNQRITTINDIPEGKHPRMKMLSRQVMQVTIDGSKVVPVVDKDGNKYAQAHVATPYGVTRELLIPIVPGDDKPAAPVEGYTLKPNEVTATAKLTCVKPDGTCEYKGVVVTSPREIEIDWFDASGSVPNKLDVVFHFQYINATIKAPCQAIRVKESGNKFTIGKADLEKLAVALFQAIPADARKAGSPLFATSLTTTAVKITPISNKHAVQTVNATNQLTVRFSAELTGPECPPEKKTEKKDDAPAKDMPEEDTRLPISGEGLSLPRTLK